MVYVFRKTRNKIFVTCLDIVGYVFFFFRFFIKKQFPLQPAKILIVRLDHIGDFVCTSPLFRNIKAQFPNAAITALVNPVSRDLAQRNPFIDNVMVFSPFWLGREKKFLLKDVLRLLRNIRREEFDLGIDPRGDLFSIVIMFLGRVKYRIGYGITGGGFLLDQKYAYDRNAHIIERNLKVLRALNTPLKFDSAEVYYSDDDKNLVEKLLQEIGHANAKAIVLHPFAGTPAKQWPEENFRKLIYALRRDNWNIFMVGTKQDAPTYSNVYDVRGRLNLTQLAYLIKRVGFFVGLDSGPANIAAATGVPTVVICSGTNISEQWLPSLDTVSLIYKNVTCRPCAQIICPKEKHCCMEDITVEEIIDTINGLCSQCKVYTDNP
jgi:heptosyltransferase-2